jgi:hypothetical protein
MPSGDERCEVQPLDILHHHRIATVHLYDLHHLQDVVVLQQAQEPRLALDIVPTGKPGQFKVSYKNAALPKAKVGLVTPSGWMKEAHSDAEGLVQFDLPWQGVYVAEVHHTDKTAGERDGKPYDIASFVTTLSLIQPKGLKALPAAPAATPNK